MLDWFRIDADNKVKSDDVNVFTGGDASIKSFRTAWGSARSAAKLPTARFHDFRSEYASRLVERGIPLSQVRDLLAGAASLASTVLLLSSGDAVALSLRSGSNANPLFPGLTAAGGVLAGLPALASDEVGPRLIAVDTSKIVLVDNGEVEIDRATAPAVQMVTNPSSSATSLVSLFQTDSILLRVLRRLTWARVDDSAVTWLDSVGYLHEGGSPSA